MREWGTRGKNPTLHPTQMVRKACVVVDKILDAPIEEYSSAKRSSSSHQSHVSSLSEFTCSDHGMDGTPSKPLINPSIRGRPILQVKFTYPTPTCNSATDLLLSFVQITFVLLSELLTCKGTILVRRIQCGHCEQSQSLLNMINVNLVTHLHLCQSLRDSDDCLKLTHCDGDATISPCLLVSLHVGTDGDVVIFQNPH